MHTLEFHCEKCEKQLWPETCIWQLRHGTTDTIFHFCSLVCLKEYDWHSNWSQRHSFDIYAL